MKKSKLEFIKISKQQLIFIILISIAAATGEINYGFITFCLLYLYCICLNLQQEIIDKYNVKHISQDKLIKEKATEVINEFSQILNERKSGSHITKLCYGLTNDHLDKLDELKKLIFKEDD